MELQLQEELLIEILAQLPVKSLIRLVCICKHWHSIITSSEFAAKHHATRLKMNQSNNDNDYGYDRILSRYSEACSISITSYEDLTHETAFKLRPEASFVPPKFGISHRDIIFEFRIYGPCNGIFFLEFYRRSDTSAGTELVWLLWNPAIRDTFKVPKVELPCSYVGFGFDDLSNDYKIVCFDFNASPSRRSPLLLYSLAGNSWRQVDSVSCLDFIGYGGYGPMKVDHRRCYGCNGRKHHWIMTETITHFEHVNFLLSFDVVDEVLVQTLMPDNDRWHYCSLLDQGSHNVNPTLYYVTHDNAMHIWRLNEYGPTGSWTKLKTLLSIPRVVSCSPMVFWKNKGIVFANWGDKQAMAQYDLIAQQVTSLDFPGDHTVVAYTESLFSVEKFRRGPRPPVDYSPSVAALVRDQRRRFDEMMTAPLLQQYQQYQQQAGLIQVQQHDDSNLDYSALEIEFQQLLLQHGLLVPQNHNHDINDGDGDGDEDDSSSTDSAFLMPIGPRWQNHPIFSDYEADFKFIRPRSIEQQKLMELPYCLREVNQPMIPNPCTF